MMSSEKCAIYDVESDIYATCAYLEGKSNYNFQDYIDSIDKTILTVLDDLEITRFLIIMDNNKPTFRHKEFSQYKANRADSRKPRFFYDVKAHLQQKWGAVYAYQGLEADDEVLLHANAWRESYDVYVIGIDKDLRQFPGKFYNQKKKELIELSSEQAYYNFWMQVLTGDSTDNIPGLGGVGEVTARRILDAESDHDHSHKVWLEYSKAFGIYRGTKEMTKTLTLVNILKRVGDAVYHAPGYSLKSPYAIEPAPEKKEEEF